MVLQRVTRQQDLAPAREELRLTLSVWLVVLLGVTSQLAPTMVYAEYGRIQMITVLP